MSNPYKLNHNQYSTHSIIKKQLGTSNTVLDVGCNDGYLGLNDTRSNIFYGLDISSASINIAKSHYKDAIVRNLNETTPLPWDTKFDVMLFADVLEHLEHPKNILSYYKQYLKDDGKVIISLPNIANWQIRLSLLLGNFNYTDSGILDRTHLHFYTFDSAKKLATDSEYKVRKTIAGASFFGPLIKALPFLKGLLATNIILVLE